MTIKDLLAETRKIWGTKKMTLDEIVIANGVTVGDIHRYTRDKNEGQKVDQHELKKELGNMIFSAIRWCDDLGFNPEDCINLAKQAQTNYQKRSS